MVRHCKLLVLRKTVVPLRCASTIQTIYFLRTERAAEYECCSQACCFHGTEPIVAVGLVTGQVQAFRLASNGNASTSAPVEAFTKKPHKESCRAIGFSLAGHRLYTGSADG